MQTFPSLSMLGCHISVRILRFGINFSRNPPDLGLGKFRDRGIKFKKIFANIEIPIHKLLTYGSDHVGPIITPTSWRLHCQVTE